MRSAQKARLLSRLAGAESLRPVRAERRRRIAMRHSICSRIYHGGIATEQDLIAEASRSELPIERSDIAGVRIVEFPSIGIMVLVSSDGALMVSSLSL